jgi:hypothetical protein
MLLDTSPGWPGFAELTQSEQEALLNRIAADQRRGDTLGGGRRAREVFGLPGVVAPDRTGPVPGSKAAARAGRERLLE